MIKAIAHGETCSAMCLLGHDTPFAFAATPNKPSPVLWPTSQDSARGKTCMRARATTRYLLPLQRPVHMTRMTVTTARVGESIRIACSHRCLPYGGVRGERGERGEKGEKGEKGKRGEKGKSLTLSSGRGCCDARPKSMATTLSDPLRTMKLEVVRSPCTT